MQSFSPSTSFRNYDVNSMYAVTNTGKSIIAKIMKNGMYGKIGDSMQHWVKEVTVAKAYKGEWCVKVPWQNYKSAKEWFHETLGGCGHDRKYRWRENYNKCGTFFLRNEADVLMFRLRWM